MLFTCFLDKAEDERNKEHPWFIPSCDKYLGILSHNVSVFWSKQRSPMREYFGVVDLFFVTIVNLGIEVLIVL